MDVFREYVVKRLILHNIYNAQAVTYVNVLLTTNKNWRIGLDFVLTESA